MSVVTVVYDGSKQPSHLAKGFSFKLKNFVHGEPQDISPELAGHLLATCEKGAFEVKAGIPVPWTGGTVSAKLALRKAADHARVFGLDAGAVVDAYKPLSAALRKLTIEEIDAGKCDARLGDLAVWAQLGGSTDIAKAAARRAEALRLKG